MTWTTISPERLDDIVGTGLMLAFGLVAFLVISVMLGQGVSSDDDNSLTILLKGARLFAIALAIFFAAVLVLGLIGTSLGIHLP